MILDVLHIELCGRRVVVEIEAGDGESAIYSIVFEDGFGVVEHESKRHPTFYANLLEARVRARRAFAEQAARQP